MATPALVETLKASGGSERAGFLNDIVSHLWPNICVLTSDMVKSIVEPMFAQMLPSPLNSLHFAKIDLGKVPLGLSNIDVHQLETGALKMDLDIDWDGECDIELDGKMIPKIGIEHIKLNGRLSILMNPIINTIPLIGAMQAAFIDPPYLKFTYTDTAAIANLSFIDNNINKIIMGIMSGMAVLPNRFLIKMDAKNDWFKTYQYPIGVIRLTIEGATNLGEAKEKKGFLSKLVHDVPDCYAEATLGADTFKTKTINNQRDPKWAETHDFLLSDHDQHVTVDVVDADTTSNDQMGKAKVTVKEILLGGGVHELQLLKDEKPVEAKVQLKAEYLNLVPDRQSLDNPQGKTHGILTVLIASVHHIKGEREALKPSVQVKWGEKTTFRTAIKADAEGSDIQNPGYDVAYTVPITAENAVSTAPPVRLALLDGEKERGFVEIPLAQVLAAPDLTLIQDFKLQGDDATIRAGVVLRGTQLAQLAEPKYRSRGGAGAAAVGNAKTALAQPGAGTPGTGAGAAAGAAAVAGGAAGTAAVTGGAARTEAPLARGPDATQGTMKPPAAPTRQDSVSPTEGMPGAFGVTGTGPAETPYETPAGEAAGFDVSGAPTGAAGKEAGAPEEAKGYSTGVIGGAAAAGAGILGAGAAALGFGSKKANDPAQIKANDPAEQAKAAVGGNVGTPAGAAAVADSKTALAQPGQPGAGAPSAPASGAAGTTGAGTTGAPASAGSGAPGAGILGGAAAAGTGLLGAGAAALGLGSKKANDPAEIKANDPAEQAKAAVSDQGTGPGAAAVADSKSALAQPGSGAPGAPTVAPGTGASGPSVSGTGVSGTGVPGTGAPGTTASAPAPGAPATRSGDSATGAGLAGTGAPGINSTSTGPAAPTSGSGAGAGTDASAPAPTATGGAAEAASAAAAGVAGTTGASSKAEHKATEAAAAAGAGPAGTRPAAPAKKSGGFFSCCSGNSID